MMTRHHMLLRFSGEWSVLIERGVNMASRSAQSATFRLRRVGNIRSAGLLASVALACSSPTASAQQHGDPVAPFPVSIKVDAGQSLGALPPAWRFFGADEPNYVTMKDGRKLIAELGSLRRDKVFFRTHNLLNTGDGTSAFKWGSTDIYKEDANGHPIYDWTVVDRIIDTYRAAGVRPYLQLGFMPRALSTAPADVPYQHSWRPGFRYDLISGGWAYPPKNYDKWAELIYQWTLHNVQRYGRNEVENWYFEVWNEPNGPAYWKGTREEFYKLYDYAAAITAAAHTDRLKPTPLPRPLLWIAFAKFLTDAAWYFYLFWLPKYLFDARGFDLQHAASIGWIPYAMSGVGCLVGGAFSSHLLRSGHTLNVARKAALGASAALMPWVMLVPAVPSIWQVLALFSLAFFGQQSWSTLIMTLPADLAPLSVLGRAAGLVGLAGAAGGVVMGQVAGWLLDHGFTYTPVLLIAGSLHVIAFAVICIAVPRLQPATKLESSS